MRARSARCYRSFHRHPPIRRRPGSATPMAPLPRPATHPCALNPNPPLLPLNLTPSLSLYLPLQAAKLCDPARSTPRPLFPAPCCLFPVPPASTPAPLPPSSPCRAAPQPPAAQAPMPRKRQPKPPPCGLPHCAVAPDRQATARVQRSTPPAAHLPPRTRPASPASAAQPENTGPSPHSSSRPAQTSDHPSPQWLEPQQKFSRQISASIGPAISSLSVVRDGVVQCSLTSSPTRLAVNPETTSGSFSDGGSGGPGLAHPLSRASASAAPSATASKLHLAHTTGRSVSDRLSSQIIIQPEAIAFLERVERRSNRWIR